LRRHFDEVKAEIPSHFNGFKGRDNAFLLALIIYEPHFADADLLVDPQVFVCQLASFGLAAQPQQDGRIAAAGSERTER
jgi:hypothetical protein